MGVPVEDRSKKGGDIMERIQDEVLIQYLNLYYSGLYGFKKTGIEGKRKAWFIDQANQRFCLCLVDEKNNPRYEALCKISY